MNDKSIDAQTRATIQYAMERNDPWLARLVKRADAGESIVDAVNLSQTLDANEDASSSEKIEALSEIICGGGDEFAGALLVLMGIVANSTHPKVLAHTAKHFVFTRCGELNLNGMVDAQIAVLEGELLRGNTHV